MIFAKTTVQCACMMMVLVMDIGDAATAKQVEASLQAGRGDKQGLLRFSAASQIQLASATYPATATLLEILWIYSTKSSRMTHIWPLNQ